MQHAGSTSCGVLKDFEDHQMFHPVGIAADQNHCQCNLEQKLASCRHIAETVATRYQLRKLYVKGRRPLQLFRNLIGKYHISHAENVRSFDICPYALLRSCSCSAILYCYNWSHCETTMPCYPYPSFSFICNLFICLYSV